MVSSKKQNLLGNLSKKIMQIKPKDKYEPYGVDFCCLLGYNFLYNYSATFLNLALRIYII